MVQKIFIVLLLTLITACGGGGSSSPDSSGSGSSTSTGSGSGDTDTDTGSSSTDTGSGDTGTDTGSGSTDTGSGDTDTDTGSGSTDTGSGDTDNSGGSNNTTDPPSNIAPTIKFVTLSTGSDTLLEGTSDSVITVFASDDNSDDLTITAVLADEFSTHIVSPNTAVTFPNSATKSFLFSTSYLNDDVMSESVDVIVTVTDGIDTVTRTFPFNVLRSIRNFDYALDLDLDEYNFEIGTGGEILFNIDAGGLDYELFVEAPNNAGTFEPIEGDDNLPGFLFTPRSDRTASYTFDVKFRVTTEFQELVSEIRTITVVGNSAPYLAKKEYTLDEGTSLLLYPYVKDADGDSISIELLGISDNIDSGYISPSYDGNNEYRIDIKLPYLPFLTDPSNNVVTLTLALSDGNFRVEDDITINIIDIPNAVPIIEMTTVGIYLNENTRREIDFSFYDPDSSDAWAQIENVADDARFEVSITDDSSIMIRAVDIDVDEATHSFDVVVQDNEGGRASQTVTVTVADSNDVVIDDNVNTDDGNLRFSVESQDVEVLLGETKYIQADPITTSRIVSSSLSEASLVDVSVSDFILLAIEGKTVGTGSITYSVTNESGEVANQVINITVKETVNIPPKFIHDVNTFVLSPGEQRSFTFEVFDPDSDDITFNISFYGSYEDAITYTFEDGTLTISALPDFDVSQGSHSISAYISAYDGRNNVDSNIYISVEERYTASDLPYGEMTPYYGWDNIIPVGGSTDFSPIFYGDANGITAATPSEFDSFDEFGFVLSESDSSDGEAPFSYTPHSELGSVTVTNASGEAGDSVWLDFHYSRGKSQGVIWARLLSFEPFTEFELNKINMWDTYVKKYYSIEAVNLYAEYIIDRYFLNDELSTEQVYEVKYNTTFVDDIDNFSSSMEYYHFAMARMATSDAFITGKMEHDTDPTDRDKLNEHYDTVFTLLMDGLNYATRFHNSAFGWLNTALDLELDNTSLNPGEYAYVNDNGVSVFGDEVFDYHLPYSVNGVEYFSAWRGNEAFGSYVNGQWVYHPQYADLEKFDAMTRTKVDDEIRYRRSPLHEIMQ